MGIVLFAVMAALVVAFLWEVVLVGLSTMGASDPTNL